MLTPEQLHKYIPTEASAHVADYLNRNKIKLIITPDRRSKLGSFKLSHPTGQALITVNGTLNKYHFLLVLIHEIAHLEVSKNYKRRPLPHGKEWKQTFRDLLLTHISLQHFDPQLIPTLTAFAHKPLGSFNPRSTLALALSQYDTSSKTRHHHQAYDGLTVENVPTNAIFTSSKGIQFRKGELKPRSRTQYICLRLDNNQQYLVHKQCPIKEIL